MGLQARKDHVEILAIRAVKELRVVQEHRAYRVQLVQVEAKDFQDLAVPLVQLERQDYWDKVDPVGLQDQPVLPDPQEQLVSYSREIRVNIKYCLN